MGVYFGVVASVKVAIKVCTIAGCNSILVGSEMVIHLYFIVSVEGVVVCNANFEGLRVADFEF